MLIFFYILKKYFFFNYKKGHMTMNIFLYIILILLFGLIINISNISLDIKWGFLYIICFLIFLFSLENIYQLDNEDGTIDLLYITKNSLEFFIFIKSLIHWISYGFPLIIISPILMIFLKININNLMISSLYISTLSLSYLGILCCSLIIELNNKLFFIIIIIIPLYIPIIIYNSHIEYIYNIYSIYIYLIIIMYISTWLTSFIIKNNKKNL